MVGCMGGRLMDEQSFKLRVRVMPHSSLAEVMDTLTHHLMEANVAWWEVEEDQDRKTKPRAERRPSLDAKPRGKEVRQYVNSSGSSSKETLFPEWIKDT
jgi:hypothetical protein